MTNTSMFTFAQQIVNVEGVFSGLWRPGGVASMLAMGCSAFVRMGTYPYIRDWLVGKHEKTPAIMFGTGFAAGGVGYFIACPLFQAKTRSQAVTVMSSPKKVFGVAHHLSTVWHEGGLPACYRGASPLVARGALFMAGQALGYDGTKTLLAQRNSVLKDGPVLHVLASATAALFAATFSAPADYIMTRYQTASQMKVAWSSPGACLMEVVKNEGPFVLYRGWLPYFGRIFPVFLTMLPLMEQLRYTAGLGYMK